MRNILFIGLLIGGAFMAGWFKVNRDGDNTTIEINKAEIRADTRKVIDRGRDFLDRQELDRDRENQEGFSRGDADSRFGDPRFGDPAFNSGPRFDQRSGFDQRDPRRDDRRFDDRSFTSDPRIETASRFDQRQTFDTQPRFDDQRRFDDTQRFDAQSQRYSGRPAYPDPNSWPRGN